MAVAFDAATTSDNAGSPKTLSHTAAAGADLVVGLFKFEKDASAVNGTPTYGGVNMTKLTEFDPVNAIGKMEIWYLVATATGAQDGVVAWTNTADDAMIAFASFTGTNQTTPLSGAATAEGESTTPSRTVASGTDDLVVDFVSVAGTTLTFTPGADQTERFDLTTLKAGSCCCTTEPGAATVTMTETISGAGGKWMQIGFNVEAVAAAAGGFRSRIAGGFVVVG